jgi:signal transduction histidine kinase
VIRVVLRFGVFTVAAVSLSGARWVRMQTEDRAGTVMIVILLVHAAMATFVAAQMLSTSLVWKTIWSLLWYALLHAVNPIWLLLAVYYTGRGHWLTKTTWGLVIATSLVPAALVLTTPVQNVLIADVWIESEPFRHIVAATTATNEVLLIVALVPIFLALLLFLRQFLFSWRTARLQAGALILGVLSVFVPALLGSNGFLPSPFGPTGVYGAGIPFGLFGTGVFGVLVALALFRTKLFAVAPLARNELFDSFDEGILVIDANLSIVDYNDTAREYFPDVDQHIGESLERAYPALVPADHVVASDGGGVKESAVDFETADVSSDTGFAETVRTTDGDRTLRITVFEVASGGESRGYGLIVRDVTELEAYASDLEERTEQLEAKTEQLERFASVLSHDLRNPVSIATGYAELEQEKHDPENLRRVINALERIDETIEDLLVLSQEGETVDDPEAFSLRSVTEDAWRTSDTGNAVLQNELDDVLVCADASRLRTMLENLFRNAVDHGAETVRTDTISDESDEFGFFVADDGPGIPEDERDDVFDYGYTTSDDGTGYGLAIVASIADAHGWEIAVTESSNGCSEPECEPHQMQSTADSGQRSKSAARQTKFDGGARFDITGVERP